MAEPSQFDPDHVLALKFPESIYVYAERDAAVYALGVGACGRDAIDADELKFVYHENGQQFIQVLPTFAALFSLASMTNGIDLPGLQYITKSVSLDCMTKALLYRLSGDYNPLHSDPMIAKVAAGDASIVKNVSD
ncbi:hypothetical protein GH714_016620 [Hevea brasiliensis]|uniref:Peroxisomal multifunctional enzyme type 2-like N-terminal domain-containing protein n=1 Tax=Hevea brasiliensis TaxID=3981 RepID=A0A6A6NHX8_HEVBR|nr:hypothetical protein GH714_016620 [Hevea brasiliensis]